MLESFVRTRTTNAFGDEDESRKASQRFDLEIVRQLVCRLIKLHVICARYNHHNHANVLALLDSAAGLRLFRPLIRALLSNGWRLSKGNTADRSSALLSLTSGIYNTAVVFFALRAAREAIQHGHWFWDAPCQHDKRQRYKAIQSPVVLGSTTRNSGIRETTKFLAMKSPVYICNSALF